LEKHLSKGDRMFVAAAHGILIASVLLIAFPILNLVSVSLSGANHVYSGAVKLWPMEFQLDAYRYILDSKTFFSAFKVSVLLAAAGSLIGVVLAVFAAYPLSKPHLPGRKWIVLVYVFTMMFSGGIVPQYLLMHSLHLLNTIWAVIFPSVTNVFNLLIMKNFLETLPDEIEEAAKIDGASQLKILFHIMLPLSTPVIATIFLFFAVGFWNDYFNARMYITDQQLMPLQVYLRTVIFEAQNPAGNFALDQNTLKNVAPQSIINATVFLSMLPMVVLYPFLQKYFQRGMVIGSVKG
jgi:ABC-type sugar transport system, permease component